jgi:hypothetical protein
MSSVSRFTRTFSSSEKSRSCALLADMDRVLPALPIDGLRSWPWGVVMAPKREGVTRAPKPAGGVAEEEEEDEDEEDEEDEEEATGWGERAAWGVDAEAGAALAPASPTPPSPDHGYTSSSTALRSSSACF